jgi:hypothetical protein
MSSRFLAKIAIGVMILASPVALPAATALAAGPVCTSGGAISACVQISGSGDHITRMKGWATSNEVFPLGDMHIELEGPHGKIKNCASFTLPGYSNGPNCVWTPNRKETPGRYCSTLWWYNPYAGGYEDFGTPCITVSR